MYVHRAGELRRAWKLRGDPPCPHPEVDEEMAVTGFCTGRLVCTVCGYAVPPLRSES